jgi:hypothetical protein
VIIAINEKIFSFNENKFIKLINIIIEKKSFIKLALSPINIEINKKKKIIGIMNFFFFINRIIVKSEIMTNPR